MITKSGMSVTGPCGHEADFDAAWAGRDRYACPTCGLRWHVTTGPVEVYPSGFVMPGKRTVVVEAQRGLPMALPHPDDLRARQLLAQNKPAPLKRVLRQAQASRKQQMEVA